ncbi:hypothetical protein [Paenibacillus tundrae]|nr:hypothetical protein [Paenibacillus tundrae]
MKDFWKVGSSQTQLAFAKRREYENVIRQKQKIDYKRGFIIMGCEIALKESAFFRELLEKLIQENSEETLIFEETRVRWNEVKRSGEVNLLCGKCQKCLDLDKYIMLLYKFFNEEISKNDLRIELYEWTQAENIDDCLNIGVPTLSSEDFNISPFKNNDKPIYYLDLNVINQYKEIKFIKDKIEISKKIYEYAYSPAHVFEISRMNNYDRLKDISELTANLVILPEEVNLYIGYENPNYSLERIKKKPEYLRNYEEYWFNESKIRELYFPEFENEEFRKRVGSSNDLFFEFKEQINKALLFVGSFQLDMIKKDIEQRDYDEVLFCLYCALNIISYKCDNDERKFKSGLYDLEHLKYAWKADYLVTRDKKFYIRAKQIYNLLNFKTVVITYDDFLEKHL